MAKPAARLNDMSTGHTVCWPPRPNISASPDVFINNRGAHRQGDAWAVHCRTCFIGCHGGNLASGSPTVYVNNKQLGRIQDPVNCGDFVATGSPDVFVGP